MLSAELNLLRSQPRNARLRPPLLRAASDHRVGAAASPPPALRGKKNLVLIGGRGSGKSSICKRLAIIEKRWNLFPLDTLIQYEEKGKSIAQIVADNGWQYFRDLEYEMVVKSSSMPQWALIDAGGGVVVDLDASGQEVFSERKVQQLKETCAIVYVRRDVDYLKKRIARKAAREGGADSNRPNLDPTKGFDEIMARRDPWYRQAADLVLEGSEMNGDPISKEELTAAVVKWYGEVNAEASITARKAEVREHLASTSAMLVHIQGLIA